LATQIFHAEFVERRFKNTWFGQAYLTLSSRLRRCQRSLVNCWKVTAALIKFLRRRSPVDQIVYFIATVRFMNWYQQLFLFGEYELCLFDRFYLAGNVRNWPFRFFNSLIHQVIYRVNKFIYGDLPIALSCFSISQTPLLYRTSCCCWLFLATIEFEQILLSGS